VEAVMERLERRTEMVEVGALTIVSDGTEWGRQMRGWRFVGWRFEAPNSTSPTSS
jgi:hypothetical protein